MENRSPGDAGMSFLRHADLSPDGHWTPATWHQRKDPTGPSSGVTHRYDESDRVFLAGCSPAEPASASSVPRMCHITTNRSQAITANGSLMLSLLSHLRGAAQAEC